jgi:1-acyl-sn-glycerol-3-phosphate acyltransferase
VGWAVARFHRIERKGSEIPGGPVLVVANHPNALLDPLVIFRTAGRPTRPLARSGLFEQLFVGAMLRLLGGLPVYRRQDDATQMHRNETTFDAAIDALRRGEAVQIFPEGISHSEPALMSIRTGAARIALAAEAGAEWALGLQIVPIGLTYRRKQRFGGDVLAVIGSPFEIVGYREQFERDPNEAVRELTEEVARQLQVVTLNLTDSEDLELIETAERLYTREKGMHRWREREAAADRLPRLQAFARGLAWLRANDPPRHTRLERTLRLYQQGLGLFGATEADVPPRYRMGEVVWYAIREGLALLLLFPLALVGAVVWTPVYLAPIPVLRAKRPAFESIATWKLATGFFSVPLTCLVGAAIVWWVADTTMAIGALLLLPILGLAVIAFARRWRRVREDTLIFLRAVGRPRSLDRMAGLRSELASEFDRILTEAPEILRPEVPEILRPGAPGA